MSLSEKSPHCFRSKSLESKSRSEPTARTILAALVAVTLSATLIAFGICIREAIRVLPMLDLAIRALGQLENR